MSRRHGAKLLSPFVAPIVAVSVLVGAAGPSFAQANKVVLAAPAGGKKPPPNPKDPKLIEAKRLFEQGEALYNKGDYEKAIEAWETSYDLSGKDLILESIANAYERLGQAEKAREYLGKWREAAPPNEREDLDARLAKLDERIAKDKADREAKEKADKEAKDKTERETTVKRDEGKLFMPGLVIGGVGAVAALTGGALDIVAGLKRPDPTAVCANGIDGNLYCRDSARSDIETSNTLATVGDILLIAGGVTAAVGVVLVVTKSKKGDETKTAVAPWFLPGGGGMMMGGKF
jgi:tetratricopeptide (TPR) repeat protein